MSGRTLAWAVVIALHALAGSALVSATQSSASVREPPTLYARIITARVANGDDGSSAADAPSVVLSDVNPVWLQIPGASIPLPTTYRLGIGIAVPVLNTSIPVDIKDFAQRAGLLPGESASVVLRIEVLADGMPGQVAVETSSGSSQVDAAAVAYVRALRWLAGSVDGVVTSFWIRYGFTFVA